MAKAQLAWWFCKQDQLPHGDNRPVSIGLTHKVEPPIIPCERGLHASATVREALQYANGSILYRVKLGGTIVSEADKFAASSRKYLARIDANAILHAWGRACALEMAHLWDCPRIVSDYLKTGDKTLRSAALSAARSAAWSAARSAAESAAESAARSAQSKLLDKMVMDALRKAGYNGK